MSVEVVIIKVDPETLNNYEYYIPVSSNLKDEREISKILTSLMKACNVGDFVRIGDKFYRRIKGGFREANTEDLAELLASKI
jgi:hypothetical protein